MSLKQLREQLSEVSFNVINKLSPANKLSIHTISNLKHFCMFSSTKGNPIPIQNDVAIVEAALNNEALTLPYNLCKLLSSIH